MFYIRFRTSGYLTGCPEEQGRKRTHPIIQYLAKVLFPLNFLLTNVHSQLKNALESTFSYDQSDIIYQ